MPDIFAYLAKNNINTFYGYHIIHCVQIISLSILISYNIFITHTLNSLYSISMCYLIIISSYICIITQLYQSITGISTEYFSKCYPCYNLLYNYLLIFYPLLCLFGMVSNAFPNNMYIGTLLCVPVFTFFVELAYKNMYRNQFLVGEIDTIVKYIICSLIIHKFDKQQFKSSIDIVFYNETHRDNECSICLCSYNKYNPIIMLNCQHMYHIHCIVNWIMEKGRPVNCPLCSQEIIIDSDEFIANVFGETTEV